MARPLPESILVVRLGAIGDVTNALAFATAVRDAAPGTHIGWVVHPLARPLVEGHPCVDRVHVWERNGGIRAWRRLVRELRAERYALAADLQRIAKSALVARASGAPRVLGFDRRRTKELSWLLTTERLAPESGRVHMLERYLEFARHLGIAAPSPRRLLPADPEAATWAGELVSRIGTAPILVNVGASKPGNRWPPERFGRLADLCIERLGPVVLTGGPEDRAAASDARASGAGEALDLVGRTTLRELYHLMDRARLFVGCDTGPMHLAAARGLPVVALFGPADPARTGPWGPGHRVVQSGTRRMEDLTVSAVADAVSAVAARSGGARKKTPEGASGSARRADVEREGVA